MSTTREPVPVLTDVQRLADDESKINWENIHEIVQTELAAIYRAIVPSASTIQVRSGSTHGGAWNLFSYRAFQPAPETGIDPIIAGLTFAAAKEGSAFLVSADISGESLGDVLFEIPRKKVSGSTAMIAAAREMCRQLVGRSDKIVGALQDSSRQQ